MVSVRSSITINFKAKLGPRFTCDGDGEPLSPGKNLSLSDPQDLCSWYLGHHGWLHWFNSPLPAGGRPNTDLWPDVSYWGDDVTIYQLVITTSFHFSLLSLIARHITIVTPESSIQSYQYITTVTLFTRTQSSTLGPRCVISCSDLFTYLHSLRHSVLGDLSIIISS